MRAVFAFASGGLGGTGLIVSGMTDTRKIQGWLDFLGVWDPTLAFVLTGAVLPMMAAWMLARRLHRSWLGQPIPERPKQRIDGRLIGGSLVFGFGWGLVGLCPGPAIASVSFGGSGGLVFLAALACGMLIAKPIRARLRIA